MNIQNVIDHQVDKMKDEIIELTSKLIQFPSVQGQEEPAQLYFAECLKKINCQVDIFSPDIDDLKKYKDLLVTRDDFTHSPNVVGMLKGTGGGKSIILNSHMDVVPAGDTDWEDSPWSGKLVGSKIMGRGASDMKGGAVTNYYAVKVLQDLGIQLKGDVIIESVVDEECGGAGTAATLSKGYFADAAIITEPTDMKVYPACMGSMWFRIKVRGKAAHGATAYLGINAVEKAYVVYDALKELEKERLKSKSHELYNHLEIPFCINIGKFTAGNWPSSVPEEAILEGRMGVSPVESVADAKREMQDAINKAAEEDPWLKDNYPELEWFGSCWVGGAIEKDHELVSNISNHHEQTLSQKPDILGAPWATDAGVLIQYGHIPTVIYGPGKGHTAHQANEYIEVDDMLNTIKVLAKSILDWCEIENTI